MRSSNASLHRKSERRTTDVCAIFESLETRCLLSVVVNINTTQQYQTIDGFGTGTNGWTAEYATPAFQQMFYQNLGASMVRIDLSEDVLQASPGDMTTPVTLSTNLQANIAKMNFGPSTNAYLEGTLAAASKTYALDSVKIIGSIWSPPNWMKGADPQGNLPVVAYGNTCGGSLIDTPANLQQFGLYVASWVVGFQQAFGVNLYAISIQNELAFREGYDSCTYTPQVYVDALKAVASAFKTYGITTLIEGPEDVGVGSTTDPALLERQMSFINAVNADPVAKAAVSIYSIHGYASDGVASDRSPDMWSQYWNDISNAGLHSWMTESSGQDQTITGALTTAAQIQDALVEGNVSAWFYWQATADAMPAWEVLTSGLDTTAPKYNAFKQFSDYIRPGAVRVSATPTDPNGVYVSAFTQAQQHTLTTVLINLGSTDQTITLDVSGNYMNSFSVDSRTSATEESVSLAPVSVVDGVATFLLPADSIVTLQGHIAPVGYSAPTIAAAAASALNPVAGANVALSVLGADPGGESSLLYTWTATGPAAVTYSANGTNAAKNTTATFTKAGLYTFLVTATDAYGLSVTSSVNVSVNQTLTSVGIVAPAVPLSPSANDPLTATGYDQFGNAMADQPTLTWSVQSGGVGGSVDATGAYTAPASGTGIAKIAATSASGIVGTASVNVVGPAAAPIATELFTGSGALLGQSDGTGWAGGWTVQNGSAILPGYQTSQATPLSYRALQTSGTYATGGQAYLTAGRALDVNGAFNAYEQPGTTVIGKTGTTVWLSALMRDDSANADGFHISLDSSGVAWDDSNLSHGIEVGYLGGTQVWSLNVGGTVIHTNTPIVAGQSTLVVVELTFGASGDTASLFINPPTVGIAPATPDAAATVADLHFSNLTYFAGDTAGMSDLGDIRFGASYASVTPPAPTVAIAAHATPNPVTLTSVNLSALGADMAGASSLAYTWTSTGSAPVTFSANGSNAARNTTVTFTQAGDYTFQVTITDPNGLTTTSSVSVTVAPTLSSLGIVTPSIPLSNGGTDALSATAYDQFGNVLTTQPTITWTVNSGGAGGSIDATGLYTAPTTGSGLDTVTATTDAGVTASTTLNIAPAAPDNSTPIFTPTIGPANGSTGGTSTPTTTPTAIATEDFTGSGALNAQNDGTGWAAGWTVQNDNTVIPGYQVSATPLSYTGLQTTGGSASGGMLWQTAGRHLDTNGAFGAYEIAGSNQLGKSGTTLWVSAVMRMDSVNTDNFHLALNSSNVPWNDTDPAEQSSMVEMGYLGGAAATWSLDVGGTIIHTNKPIVIGQAALLVVELNFTAAGDTATLFINPPALGTAFAPASADATATAANLQFSNLSYYGGRSSGMSTIGDIAIGATYASVTPALPAAPAALTAAVGPAGTVNLTWVTQANNQTSYLVQASSSPSFTSSLSYVLSAGATSDSVSGLNSGITYYFRVQAENPFGASAYSNVVSVAA